MNPTLTIKSGHFLNDLQKELKSKIMHDIFDAIGKNLHDHYKELDAQSTTDIIFSCLIMFAREILVDLIMSSGDTSHEEAILSQFHEAIDLTVSAAVKVRTANPNKETH